MPYITLGFWLPVGRPNFFRSSEDMEIDSRSEYRPEHPTVYNRLYRVLKVNKKFDKCIGLIPGIREIYYDENDPYVAYLFKKNPTNNIYNITIRVDFEGFYLIIVKYNDSVYKSQSDAFNSIKNYLINEVIGGDFYTHKLEVKDDNQKLNTVTITEYFESYRGILNFFQINSILEGLFNYNFDPNIYFEHDETKIEIQQRNYTLKKFFDEIIAYIPTKEYILMVEKIFTNLDDESFINSVKNFEENIESTHSNSNNNSNKMNLFGGDLLRRFARNTSILCLQPIKWNIETCRRFLLRETINILHRRHPVEQLENPRNKHFQYINKANSSQVKGYILLLSAKYPLINNVQHYLTEISREYNKNADFSNISDFIDSWLSLSRGIKDSIIGIETAVENARMERVLYELEELRADQEAETEITRAQEHIEWRNLTDDTESVKLTSNGVMLALLGIILTIVIYPVEIATFLLPSELFGSAVSTRLEGLKSLPVFTNYSARVLFIFIAPFILYPIIRAFGETFSILVNQFKKIARKIFRKQRISKYQFELDARIDLEINKKTIEDLIKSNFGFEEEKRYKSIEHLTIYQPENNAYRVERTSDDEALHKLHFITTAFWDKEFTNQRKSEMRCHIIYEILSHKLSSGDSFILREVRFICTNRGFIQIKQQHELRDMVVKQFIDYWLETPLSPEDAIYSMSITRL